MAGASLQVFGVELEFPANFLSSRKAYWTEANTGSCFTLVFEKKSMEAVDGVDPSQSLQIENKLNCEL